MKLVTVIFTLLFAISSRGLGQGFVNLDFESANLSGHSSGVVSADNAFPGWTLGAQYILYDSVSLSGGSLSIFDSKPPYNAPAIQGTYFAYFQSANDPRYPFSCFLSQNGQIPSWAQSMSFLGIVGGLQITFNGQSLGLAVVANTANYSEYTADISAFSGQTGQLLFNLPPNSGYAELDNLQFSSTAVPEPGGMALYALGLIGLVWNFPRRRRQI